METNLKKPQIMDGVREQIEKAARSAFEKAKVTTREDAFNEKTFLIAVDIAYKLLPLPIRIIMKKDRFRDIMVETREIIFAPHEGAPERMATYE